MLSAKSTFQKFATYLIKLPKRFNLRMVNQIGMVWIGAHWKKIRLEKGNRF